MSNFRVNLLTKVPILLVIITIILSWAKAGLIDENFLLAVDTIVLLCLFSLVKSNYSAKFCFIVFLPLLLLCAQFFISYLNPSYRIISQKNWTQLDIERCLANESNIEKVVMTSEAFKNIFSISKKDPSLSNAIFFDFKNIYSDKFPNSKSSTQELIIKYENLIKNNQTKYIPTLSIGDNSTLLNFTHKLCQVITGVILFFVVRTRKQIRILISILVINSGIMASIGIWQKLNYNPVPNQLEIFGLWNAPEPRYYFASFTYKNHWCAYALIGLSCGIGLLFRNYEKQGELFYKRFINLFLFLSLLTLIISIPLSGSRSGVLLMATTLLSVTILCMIHYNLKNWGKMCAIILLVVSGIISILFFNKKLHKDTTFEMINISKMQLDQFADGKKPFRLILWNDLLSQIMDKPLFGHGFNSYRSINPLYQSAEVRNRRRQLLVNAHSNYVPLTGFGHNDWLEKISEFGIFGLMLTCPYFYLLYLRFTRTSSLSCKILFLGILVFLGYSFVDFPSQTPACLIFFSVLNGLAIKYSYLTVKS